MEPQRLSNAPIVEAMVTILVAPSEQGSTVSLDQFQQGLETRFPRKQPRYHLDIQFTSQPETEAVSPSVSPRPKELLLLSPEGKRAVQVGPGRFAFSVINDYSTWDDLLRETQELWQRYRAVFGPQRVLRLGVRYINRLHLPLAGASPSDLLNVFPAWPDRLPLTRSLMQLSTLDENTGAEAVVTQIVEPSTEQDTGFLVTFDTDAGCAVDLAPDDDTLWDQLQPLRDLKNRIFFDAFTDRALEKYR